MTRLQANQRFLATTRGQILLLLRRATRTVDELAQALRLTDNAIRTHVTILERDGLIQQYGERRGTSKPAAVYALTPEAEQLFPKAYDQVLSLLLETLHDRMTTEEIETLLRAVGQRLAGAWQSAGGAAYPRLARAVEALNDLGGLAELEQSDGVVAIHGYRCPFAAAVPGHPEVCRLAETFLTALIGAPVQAQCDGSEPPHCSFVVLSN